MLCAASRLNFSGPTGGLGLDARGPLDMTNVACRDDPFIVSRLVQAIFSVTGMSKRNFGRTEKIKSGDTFRSITLVLSDGLRFRFANAELKHQGLIWFEPWCPENCANHSSPGRRLVNPGGSGQKLAPQEVH